MKSILTVATKDGFLLSLSLMQELGFLRLTAKWEANTQLLVAEAELMI